eukprot:CAMPEP_0185576604 /NCGR_PEP_ID=MMETSP0434-20130131/7497_1 /TAXON_ID=626734 ORGANISM="Favella taraikaensis, Strain Fe Narragansett Bay" /NCGR_SAMPLE_ID=MMETSP0434 /ASSEMBLY_ACC=CAM_ASM_000379 /LENGTH=50 /DNA_ID=CAMNT_0028193873 /DNA_START=1288 /DNA_END=1440 /DNA_ORIENTATION=+
MNDAKTQRQSKVSFLVAHEDREDTTSAWYSHIVGKGPNAEEVNTLNSKRP